MHACLILSLALLPLACSGGKGEDQQPVGRSRLVEISGKTADEVLRVSRVINLETTSESLIAFPFDLCVSGDEIFIASRNNEIKVFDMQGKYRRSIGRLGDGPGEYRTVACLFPHGRSEIGVYDWSNLRLTLFSRGGDYQMSAVLGMPGMEGVRSVLFIDGYYYVHVPSSPAQHCHVVRMDTNLTIVAGYVDADRRYLGYQDRLLFNGGIVADSSRSCLYEADSYFYGIRRLDPASCTVTDLPFEPPSFYVSMPPLEVPTSMEEALTMFQKGTNVYAVFLAGGRYLMLEYHQALGRGRVRIVYLVYDVETGKGFTIPAGTAHPSYADGQHLYGLMYHDKYSKQENAMIDNPSLLVYTLVVEGL
jgi:hypothetical protein